LTDRFRVSADEIRERMIGNMRDKIETGIAPYYGVFLPEWKKYNTDAHHLGDLQHFVYVGVWDKARSLRDISACDYSPLVRDDALRLGFHYPVALRLLERRIPGYIVAHHIAHAAYSYYESPFDEAAIMSTDGAGGFLGYLG